MIRIKQLDIKYAALILILLVSFCSCNREVEIDWTEFAPITFSSSSISLTKGDGISYVIGTVDASTTVISLVPDAKFKNDADKIWIMNDSEDDTVYDYSSPTIRKGEVLEGKWWSISYGENHEPYSIEIQLSENTYNHPRTIKMSIGCCYTYVKLELTQAAYQ